MTHPTHRLLKSSGRYFRPSTPVRDIWLFKGNIIFWKYCSNLELLRGEKPYIPLSLKALGLAYNKLFDRHI